MSDYLSRFGLFAGFLQPLSNVLQQICTRLRGFAVPLLGIATFTLAAVFGLVAFELPPRFVELALAGIAFFLLLLCGVEYAILLLITISSTLLDYQGLPYLFGFSSPELLVFFLLGLIFVNHLSSRRTFVRTPLDRPILLFVGATLVSFVNAKYNLGTVSMFRNSVTRMMLVYLVFFVVTNFIKTRRQLMKLVRGMLILATITASFMVIQQAVGSTFSILPGQKPVHNATSLGQELSGASRLASSGALIICMMLFPTLLLLIVPEYMRGRKGWLCVMLLLFPAAIAFTFDRNLWTGVAAAALALAFILRAKGARIFVVVSVLLIGAVLLGTLFNAYWPRIGTIFDALSIRFMSLFAGDELIYDSSTQFRLRENEYAIAKIRQYPILGIGPGAEYRPQIRTVGDPPRSYIHNAFLWFLIDFGIVGFLPFLWLSIAFLARGISAWYTLEDLTLRALSLGFAIGYVVVLVSSVAAPRLFGMYGVVLVGVVVGINEVVIRLDSKSDNNMSFV